MKKLFIKRVFSASFNLKLFSALAIIATTTPTTTPTPTTTRTSWETLFQVSDWMDLCTTEELKNTNWFLNKMADGGPVSAQLINSRRGSARLGASLARNEEKWECGTVVWLLKLNNSSVRPSTKRKMNDENWLWLGISKTEKKKKKNWCSLARWTRCLQISHHLVRTPSSICFVLARLREISLTTVQADQRDLCAPKNLSEPSRVELSWVGLGFLGFFDLLIFYVWFPLRPDEPLRCLSFSAESTRNDHLFIDLHQQVS